MAGTGYTSISDYLAANAGTVGREAGDLAGDVGNQLTAAKSADDAALGSLTPGQDFTTGKGYGDAKSEELAAIDSANGLGSQGGLANLMAKHYGEGQDAASWDANLLGGNAAFGAPQAQARTLSGYLDAKGAAISAQPPPVAPPPPPAPDPVGPRAGIEDPSIGRPGNTGPGTTSGQGSYSQGPAPTYGPNPPKRRQ